MQFTAPVPHKQAIEFMLNADALLLISPGNNGPVPGKLFEYLAAKKPIISIGLGDTAEVIESCQAGKSFDRAEVSELYDYLIELKTRFDNQIVPSHNDQEISTYSRQVQAQEIIRTLLK